MKKIIGLYFVLFSATHAFCQIESRYDLKLSSGTYVLPANYAQAKSTQVPSADIFEGRYFRYVQFNRLPGAEERKQLADAGMFLSGYLPDNTYVAEIAANCDLSANIFLNLRAIYPVKVEYKQMKELSDAVAGDLFPHYALAGNKVGLSITYYESCTATQIKNFLQEKGYKISFEDENVQWLNVWVNKADINSFLALPFVKSAELVDDEPKADNLVGRTDIRSNSIYTEYSGGRKYNGSGVNIALQDDGVIGPHIDYQGRIPNQFLTSNTGDHGDHCGGIIMGAGNKDPVMRGMAWGANLHVYSASNYQAFTQIATHYNTLGIRVISTSYSDGCNAGYTTRAQQLDMQNLSMPELIHVFSAGNDGASDCNYGAGATWGNVTGGHKHSKNSIAVANLSFLDVRNTSSSRGPAHDGRLKPEVSAVGTNVWSTSDTNRYVNKTGTSMSCPAVAGAFAQLYQAYKNLNANANPPSALIKAIVMNTADDLGNPGPDFGYGYGRVNALTAAKVIEQGRYTSGSVANAATSTHTIQVPSGCRRVKVMTYWHDYQAQIGAAIALVNNLNTTLVSPSAVTYSPLILNFAPNSTSLNANAVPGVDVRNNHEQIVIDAPAAGNYVLSVNGAAVPMGPQAYVVTWLFEMDGYTLTYPMGGEGFVPGYGETIRWDAFETNGNQTLEYTTNNGSSWNVISSSIPGAQRYYTWSPPNVISGQCKVRISRGAYSAKCDSMFSIIPTPSNLNLAWACPDSVKITWSAVPGATAYDVFRLGSTYMDSIATTSGTSVVVTNIPLNQSGWFSVRSRGALGAVGRRAIAVKKKPGLRNCPQIAYDVSCNNILSPAGTLVDCIDLSKVPIRIILGNPGINTLSTVAVYYSINGAQAVAENYALALSSSATAQYVFTTTASFPAAGTYTIKAWAKYAGDLIFTNDTAQSVVAVASSYVKQLPLYEDFETFSLCSTSGYCQTTCNLSNGFINEDSFLFDQHDWRTNSGAVPTASTGPSSDFQPGTANGKYVYLESSAPCAPLRAQMLSPCINLGSAAIPSLSFAYHMYGAGMGTLHVDVYAQGVWNNAVWSLSGDQGNTWQVAGVNLSAWAGDTITLRWRGITGQGSLSDMAIDAINVRDITTGINDVETSASLYGNVFPNPSKDIFMLHVQTPNNADLNYTVTDVSGRVMLQGKAVSKNGQCAAALDLHDFAAGVYFVTYESQGKSGVSKLNKL